MPQSIFCEDNLVRVRRASAVAVAVNVGAEELRVVVLPGGMTVATVDAICFVELAVYPHVEGVSAAFESIRTSTALLRSALTNLEDLLRDFHVDN